MSKNINNRVLGLCCLVMLMCQPLVNTAQWSRAQSQMDTRWTETVSPENAWPEYPRPQLVRKEWKNLNGLWDYAIKPKGQVAPKSFDGQILVPFCVESSLSGVKKELKPEDELWYRTSVNIPDGWKDKDVVLHFGAVDWEGEVIVNGKSQGTHRGGSDPFRFNITDDLKTGNQEIVLRVWDPTDTDIQPRGKQTLDPRGFWYTAVSGIWQTVWMEPVERTYIDAFIPIPDIDQNRISFSSELVNPKGDEMITLNVSFKGEQVISKTVKYQKLVSLDLEDVKEWSPSFPNLYDVSVQLKSADKVIDDFSSYFAMRKISTETDENGFVKLYLNNKELFHWGVLDQGWWPDGLLTPPTDEAMKYDMVMLKEMGFNMIRKHIKVEPDRFYYHADTLGLLVWQDMPSGFLSIHHPEQHVAHDATEDWDRPKASADQFKKEWKSIIDSKKFFPSVVVWVPFNEGWGQFETEEVVNWTMAYDPSRIVDGTSGWTDRGVGHMFDAHQYPGPGIEPSAQNKNRAIVLGEFGGLGYLIEGHLWDTQRKNWGYRTYRTQEELLNNYSRLIFNVYAERSRGLAAAIYTQTSDVEAEVNGITTYNREVVKIPIEYARVLHSPLYLNYKPANFLVKDSELAPARKWFSRSMPNYSWHGNLTPDDFECIEGTIEVIKDDSIWTRVNFEVEDLSNGLAMKVYAVGDVVLYLNGQKVVTRNFRTKRHYDDWNISDYKHLLHEGTNVISMELQATEDTMFDYALYQF